MSTKYAGHVSTRRTPQSEPIFGSKQVQNSAGGYAWAVTDETRLDRFLILGAEGGTYYATERKLTIEKAETVLRLLQRDGGAVVQRVIEISESGRAPKNDPALFVLALAVKHGDESTRQWAFEALPRVARIGTHLFTFLDMLKNLEVGWGRGLRRAVGNWYTTKDADKLAYQMAKYRQRGGWTHRDALRLSHARPADIAQNSLFRWATSGKVDDETMRQSRLILDFEAVQKAEGEDEVIRIISGNRSISHEMVPTQFLGSPQVWEALLPNLGLTALIRNLGRMTANGLLAPNSEALRQVVSRITNGEALKKARVHPFSVLVALATYRKGQGVRGKLSWQPVPRVLDALDSAFYSSFGNVRQTGKRFLFGLDVSGSMDSAISNLPMLTCREAAGAMCMVSARVEQEYHVMGFTDQFVDLGISPRQRLDDVLRRIFRSDFGGTDCALPMTWALQHRVPVDVFSIYTDNETWAGRIHPAQALREYRQQMGIPAKLVVVGMVANEFSIADPGDAGMMDVVGFDTATPNLIADFATDGASTTVDSDEELVEAEA